MTNDHGTPDLELPEIDMPQLRAPTAAILKNDYIAVTTLGWPSVSNWSERRWRAAIEKGHLPAYKFPNGRVLVKSEDLIGFVMGFAQPVRVGKGS
jgi:hypothetical protein